VKRWASVTSVVALVAACGGKSDREPAPAPVPSATSTAPREPASTSTAEPEPAPPGTCLSNADCMVVGPCCGACGTLQAEEAIALLVTQVESFRESCQVTTASCAECFRESSPYLVPACEHRMCHVLDLSKVRFTECQTGADCTLRANECCGDEDSTFVAVAANALTQLDALLCGGEPVRADCRVDPPMHQGAVCREGRCSSAFFDP
jgi:hypothetical protein